MPLNEILPRHAEFKSYYTISPSIHVQIDAVIDLWKQELGSKLVGIYLHGSMCTESFIESKSDIDLIIITDCYLTREKRLSIVEKLITIDKKPCPLEMSAIYSGDLIPWKHPVPCQFHYSDYWTERYLDMLNGKIQNNFIIDSDFTDDDIASYVKLINQCGVVLYGAPIKDVFPEVSDEDFWASISNDIDDYRFDAYSPHYFASNILILGRILSFKVVKRILSKYESGYWALGYLPDKFKPIIRNACDVWFNGGELETFDQALLDELRDYLIGEIKKQ